MGLRPTYTTPQTHPCTPERHEFGILRAGDNVCRCGARTLRADADDGCETILLPARS